MKKIVSLLLVIALCFTLTPSVASAAVKISKKDITLYVGDSSTLKISGTTKSIKWTTSDKTVASVTNGKVTGKSDGVTTITATVSKKKYTCKVTVITPLGARTNPYSAYDTTQLTIHGYSDVDEKNVSIKLVELIQDQSIINEMITTKEIYVSPATVGQKWILLKVNIEYVSGPEEELTASDILWDGGSFYNSESNKQINSNEMFVVSSESSFTGQYDAKLYPSGSSEVLYGLLVNDDIEYLTYQVATTSDSYAWFTTKQ